MTSSTPPRPAPLELPADFDLNLLRALHLLLATRSVSASARALGVGQPAVSKALQRLREHFGDELLVRVGHAMHLTPLAAGLAEPARGALEAARLALAPRAAFSPATARGRVAVAMPGHAHVSLAVPLLERMRSTAPGLDLRVRELGLASVGDLLRGDILLAVFPELGSFPLAAKPDLSPFVTRPLYRERYAVAQAARADGAPREPLTLEAYAAARHVLVTALGESEVGPVDVALRARGLTRRVAATFPSFLGAVRVVTASDLVVTLPERMLRASGYPLDLQPPPLDLPDVSMLAAWHPREAGNPLLGWLREELAACAATPSMPEGHG